MRDSGTSKGFLSASLPMASEYASFCARSFSLSSRSLRTASASAASVSKLPSFLRNSGESWGTTFSLTAVIFTEKNASLPARSFEEKSLGNRMSTSTVSPALRPMSALSNSFISPVPSSMGYFGFEKSLRSAPSTTTLRYSMATLSPFFAGRRTSTSSAWRWRRSSTAFSTSPSLIFFGSARMLRFV